jgi:hypothetical protein
MAEAGPRTQAAFSPEGRAGRTDEAANGVGFETRRVLARRTGPLASIRLTQPRRAHAAPSGAARGVQLRFGGEGLTSGV